MKKNIVIATIATLLVAMGFLIGCQKNESSNTHRPEKTHTIGSMTYTAKTIATVDPTTGEVTLLFDENDFRNFLIDSAYFDTIDSVELNYNDPTSSYPSYLTMFGTYDTLSFVIQTELVVSGDEIIMIEPDGSNDELIASHACFGAPCNSCKFERTWYLKIIDCKCREGSNPMICHYFKNGVYVEKADLYAYF